MTVPRRQPTRRALGRARPPARAVLVALALATAGVSTAASAPVAQAKTAHRCADARGRTIAANATTRVYRRPGGGTYACALPGGRSFGLGDQNAWPDLATVSFATLAGRYLAYSLSIQNRTGSAESVRLVDVRRGRATRVLPVDDEQPGDVGSVVVTTAGAVAWTVTRADGVKRVWAAPSKAAPKVLATAPGLDVGSLALGSGRVFWMQDGAPQTAAL